jgi:Tfp pilus assembly protein PilX
MILLRPLLRDQRGSALLISLVLIVVITILGLALFELGQIEGQQAGASLGDARAFELAQAGMERAIRELSNAFLADPYGSESWVDGPNRPTCTPACGTALYQAMNLANNTLPVAGVDPLTGQDPGGTFTVELKQVSVAEANNPVSQGAAYTYPYGQTCIPSAPTNPTVCANLMFVRSTGTVAGPPGFTATRTVQALVKAYSTSYFAGGLTAEKATSGTDPAIDGRVLIAGSVHILGTPTINPAFRIDGGASMGMRNNWADLWPDIDVAGVRTLYRLTPRQLVCPTGASCAGGVNLVESLEAELKVYGNTSNTMVTLSGNTDLGISTVSTAGAYGDATVGSRFGKGHIDGVYVAGGCPMPCTSNAFSFGGSSIYVDTNNYTKPYPYRPPKLPLKDQLNWASVLYPRADWGTVINGTTYNNWYAEFFVTNTNAILNPALAPITFQPAGVQLTDARLNAQTSNGGYCGPSYAGKTFGATFVAGLTASVADDSTGSFGFCHTFKWVNKAGAVTVGEICWRRRDVGLVSNDIANLPPNYLTRPTLEFGIPSCSIPNDPSNPLLIHHANTWTLAFTSPQTDYQYRGSAMIFTGNGVINIENTLQTTCSTPAATPPCVGERFPENNLLILINRQSAQVNIASQPNPANPVNRFMGYVYSEGAIRTQYLSNLVGSLRAQQFCFNNSSPASGCAGVAAAGGNPSFFQVSFPDLRRIPAELPASSGDSGNRWLVDVVPRFWIECRRGPGDTLPTTPTGTCQYQ